MRGSRAGRSPGFPAEADDLLWAGLILLHLAAVWVLPHFPTQDGPSHLDNAAILLRYNDPAQSLLRQYYTLNYGVFTNWLGTLTLAGLVSLFPLAAAEKVLLSGYTVLLAASIRYALKPLSRDYKTAALLSLPLLFHFFFYMGFHSFCFSLAFFFLFLGYWLRCHDQYRPRNLAWLAGLSVLLVGWHLFSFLAVLGAVAFLSLWKVILPFLDPSPGRPRGWAAVWRGHRTQILILAAVLLPAGALCGSYFLHYGAGRIKWTADPREMIRLLSSACLVIYSRWESILSLAFLSTLAALALPVLVSKVGRKKPAFHDGFFLIAAFFLLLALALPAHFAGGGWINDRLYLFVLFFTLLWLGARSFSGATKGRIRLAVGAITIGLVAAHTWPAWEINRCLEEYLSVEDRLEPGSTILPLTLARNDLPRVPWPVRKVDPLLHASGLLAARRGCVSLANFEATTGYYPVAYRRKLNPYRHIGFGWGLEETPPRVEFITYPQRTGGRVDYVLLWGYRPEMDGGQEVGALLEQLGKGYQPAATSPGRGLMRLYRRVEPAPLKPESH